MKMDYSAEISLGQIEKIATKVRGEALVNSNKMVWRCCIACCDATSLSESDTPESIAAFTKAISSKELSVASVCVSPIHIEDAGVALGESQIAIASVIGGFPMSKTFIEVKILEAAMAIENGADELDMVINIGAINSGRYDEAISEIGEIVHEIDGDAILKVILETGALKDLRAVRNASYAAMEAGADFIKTSTGKIAVGATLEAVIVMALSIKEYYKITGIKRGIKISGGIKTPQDAALYYTAIKEILSEEWLQPSLFRIGASSLVDALYKEIYD